MNQREAFAETIEAAERAGMPALPGSPRGLAHLKDMFGRLQPSFSEAKVGRWLGWAQCAVEGSGVGLTLEDMKQINMRWADDGAESDLQLRLARAWASMDGKESEFEAGRTGNDDLGHYEGYMVEAAELMKRANLHA